MAEDVTEQLAALGQVLIVEDGLETTLERVATLSVALIAACDACGVALVKDGLVSLRAASDSTADRIDAVQYQLGTGPCLLAIDAGEPVRVDSFAGEERWKDFIESAMQEGVRASYSIPLVIRGDVVGSLNLYSRDHAFDDADERIGALLASQAAVVLRNAQTFDDVLQLVEQLREALASRDVIGQAKGMLRARLGLDDEEAFGVLRTLSQSRNEKLRDVAAKIVDGSIDAALEVGERGRTA